MLGKIGYPRDVESSVRQYFSVLLLGLIALAVLISQQSQAVGAGEESMKALVEGNTKFALELYGNLHVDGNLFLSPFSISTALAMTYAGARGKTASQMASVLEFGLPQNEVNPAFTALEQNLHTLKEKGAIQLNVANSIWPQVGYPLLKSYLNLTKTYYGVAITPLDYRGDTETARREINTWVEEKTQNKIKDLIQPGMLVASTRLVLANAIYFKGNWSKAFKKEATKDAPFYLTGGDPVQVPTMRQKEQFEYAENVDLTVLELPYAGEELSMLVLLPRKAGGLPDLEKQLTLQNLKQWTKDLRRQEVEVFLPRFKTTSRFDLGGTLSSMGMVDAFAEGKADFSGMDGKPGWLFVGVVVHKAFVDVNEEGTEAAAATGVGMRMTSLPAPAPVFRADHPFFFLIRHNQTGSILFLGRVLNPTLPGE
jgi:serpin B